MAQRTQGRRLPVMESKTGALVLEKDSLVPSCEDSDRRAETVKLRVRLAMAHISVATTPFEAVTSGDGPGKRGDHAGKFVERSPTHYGQGTCEHFGQASQKLWQLGRDMYQMWFGSDFDDRPVEIEKECLIVPQERWLGAAAAKHRSFGRHRR